MTDNVPEVPQETLLRVMTYDEDGQRSVFEVHGPGDTGLLGTKWPSERELRRRLEAQGWTDSSGYVIANIEHPERMDLHFKRWP
jgi:hypothetical protein